MLSGAAQFKDPLLTIDSYLIPAAKSFLWDMSLYWWELWTAKTSLGLQILEGPGTILANFSE